jgi:hypothetical protein
MVTNNFTYLNSGLMVKDLFCKHGGEGRWGEVKGSNLHISTLSWWGLGS